MKRHENERSFAYVNITLTSLSRAHSRAMPYYWLKSSFTKCFAHAKRVHTATLSSKAKYICVACIACSRTRFTESENACRLECGQHLCLECFTQHVDSNAGMYSPLVYPRYIPPSIHTDRQIKEVKISLRYEGVLNLWKNCRRRRGRYCDTGSV